MIKDKDEWRKCWIDHVVNRHGTVLRESDSKVVPFVITPSGYAIVNLYNLTTRPQRVHRLVASAFIENPLEKEHVNHKDGILERFESIDLIRSRASKAFTEEVVCQ